MNYAYVIIICCYYELHGVAPELLKQMESSKFLGIFSTSILTRYI